ncbi:malate dehydrogenase [Anaplasma bovis]|uniref:malate dehydrogenase n=1 Tax=Anaplasma bovis TaxID=186733 RepID=UPI002FF102D8
MCSAKVSLVGVGNIGGLLAYMLGAERGVVSELALIDLDDSVLNGKLLDLVQGLTISGTDIAVTCGSDYAALEGSDAVVVTAGLPRKPGMSRDDLRATNAEIIKKVAEGIGKYCPNAFVIVVTNPLDVMTWCMHKYSGLPANRVLGMAGVLDSARFSLFLAQEMNVSVACVSSLVLGGHGDLMLPLLKHSTVSGVSIEKLIEDGRLEKARVDAIIERTRRGGEEIVKLLKTGSAYCAPAASCMKMLRSHLRNSRDIMPCSVYLNGGKYGVTDGLFAGVPVVIGKNGVEEIIDLDLTSEERNFFDLSVDLIRKSVNTFR